MSPDIPSDSVFSLLTMRSPAAKVSFDNHGFILVKQLLSVEELGKVGRVIREGRVLERFGYGIPDEEGKMPRMALWNTPGSDVTGMVCRSEKVVDTAELLLEGEVYHYHSKLVVKEPFIGGKQEWHQDYGYWYMNTLLTPDALSIFIPLDKCTRSNGCLQVISGSQKCGRIDHVSRGGQTGAELGRVEEIKQDGRFQHLYVEMEAGDALFFHSNVLHASDANTSPQIRRALILAYNRDVNSAPSPDKAGHHPVYSRIEKVPDTAILSCANFTDFSGKEFLDPKVDKTVKAEK